MRLEHLRVCFLAALAAVCVLWATTAFAQTSPLDDIVRAGDAIEITVVGNREFSGIYVVDLNGRVPYPFLKYENVIGWTMTQLEQHIAGQIANVVTSAPYVIADRALTYPIRISVLGQIDRPGFIDVPNGITLQGALWMAGGPSNDADLSDVQIQRVGPNGIELLSVDLERFLFEGRTSDLVHMQDGDLIVVKGTPDADKIKVFGEVHNSGSFVPPYGATVLDMIYRAGGATRDGTLSDVRWLRKVGDTTVEEKLDISGLLRAGQTERIPLVGRGDVIIVQRKLITLQTIFQTISLIVQLFTVRELLRRI